MITPNYPCIACFVIKKVKIIKHKKYKDIDNIFSSKKNI